MHRNPLRDGLAQKSVAYEIPRGGIAAGVWSPQFLSLRHREYTSRSSHALPSGGCHSCLAFPRCIFCITQFRPYARGIIFRELHGARYLIVAFNWHSHILLGRFARRQCDYAMSNEYSATVSLFISTAIHMLHICIAHNWMKAYHLSE